MLQGARREMSRLAATAEKREVNASGLLLHESKNTGSSKSFSCSAIVIPSTDHVVFDLAAMRQALISERIEWATFCFEGFVFKKICTQKNVFSERTLPTLSSVPVFEILGEKKLCPLNLFGSESLTHCC